MIGDSLGELKRLSAKWHDEVVLLRKIAAGTVCHRDKYALAVMANTYVVCASALDELLGCESTNEKLFTKPTHAKRTLRLNQLSEVEI